MRIINRLFFPITILLAICCCNISVQAQFSAGISAGFTATQPDKDPKQAYAQYLPAGGFAIGIPLQYELSKRWAIRAEPGLFQKNISFERTGSYAGSWDKRYNSYVQLPLMVQYRTGEWRKFSGFAQVGVSAGYLVAARQEGAAPDIYDLIDTQNPDGTHTSWFRIKEYNGKYTFDSKKDQRFDIGAVAALGLNYHYNHRYTFYLELRYSQSFNSYEKEYMNLQERPKYLTGTAMIGCMMQLFNRK